MREQRVHSDVTVVGGGLAGVCAAVAAARLGRRVCLITNRPVLGGNSSSEVRVWVVGATAHGVHRFAREGGIMGELFVENQYRNPEGNPYLWDALILDTVRAESNISLFLNTDVREVSATGPRGRRRIESVSGWTMGSELSTRFESPIFLDCTGDGLVGYLAGAQYRIGREARHEFGEEWAPEVADDITLGSTLLFYTKDAGENVEYVPPSFAKDITQTSIPEKRVIRSGDNGCAYWWIEWGGELDTVHENERIRDELWSVIYGIWDYIKNSGKFDADTMTLEWVGSIPGKREYRRFVGDHMLTQNEVLDQELFDDRVAFGGWSIDLHPPEGMYAADSGSKHLHIDGSYHIPYRCLYSVNVENLMFAGRDISASHVAFGTTRVMATCATVGEATGTAAALCADRAFSPRELGRSHTTLLQQTLLRQDGSVLGIRNTDEADLARSATVTASSTLTSIEVDPGELRHRLHSDAGVVIPADPGFAGLSIVLDADADSQLNVEVYETGQPQNYVPATLMGAVEVPVERGNDQRVAVPVAVPDSDPRNVFVVVRANPDVTLHAGTTAPYGVLSFTRQPLRRPADRPQPVLEWRPLASQRMCLAVAVEGATDAYAAGKALNGYTRPYGGPNLWASGPMLPYAEQWLQLSFDDEADIAEIRLTFNDDVNEDLINLHHHRTEFRAPPQLVRDYRLEACGGDGAWKVIARVRANRRRHRIHRLGEVVRTSAIRVVVETTWGIPRAEIIEIRAYAESP
ncbi:FAD-dependent oxidoreductase [Phytoactinopolyspora halotolerans]|uniref:FAD-dependent oxidoreductase n=1 Tax=Phytoactinopolyspora halotolerans TaxID=1981512 RepID=A0A6L9SFG6_9ACTN|nr:FAD-dependent oxidoreductase [Phytoactinopolyspora halotolerans]NEE03384.1 FAD-dependent oxidoreductase [Phytoactinopolyspora halotolerans]